MPPTLSPEKTTAILTGAMQQFLSHGYAAASMAKVAAAANVSKATVYSHFEDKEHLFGALIRQLASEKFASVLQLNDEHTRQQPPQQVLRDLANSLLNQATQDPQLQNFMRLIVGESGRFPRLAQLYVENIAQPWLGTLTHYLASHPAIHHPDPEALARVFVGTLVYHVLLQEVMHGKGLVPLDRDRIITTLVDLMVPPPPLPLADQEGVQ